MRTLTILLLSWALLAPAAAAAPAVLTLEQSVKMAQAVQPALRLAETDAALAGERLGVANAALRPSLELAGGYLNSSSRDGNLDFIANNAPHELRGQLVGRWPLDTGQAGAGVRQAEADAQAARWGLVTAERSLALGVAQAYFGVLRAEATEQALASARTAAARELSAARTRFANGQITQLDVGRQEQALLVVEADWAGARADRTAARARFALLTGAREGFRLADPGVPAGGGPATGAERPEVRQAEAAMEAQRAAAEAAHLALRPQVALNAAAGWDAAGWPGFHNAGVAAGADLSWPLFDGGRLRSQAAIAELNARRAALDLAGARLSAQNDMIDARARLERARSQYDALQRGAALAERNFERARIGYAEGALGGLELLAAQRAALDARLAALNALCDLQLAASQLRWAAGSP